MLVVSIRCRPSVSALSTVHSHVDICLTACVRTRGYYSILWFTIALYVLKSIWRPHRIWLRLWPIFQCTGATQRLHVRAILAFDWVRCCATGYATMSCNSIRYYSEPHTISPNPSEMYLFIVNECVIKSDHVIWVSNEILRFGIELYEIWQLINGVFAVLTVWWRRTWNGDMEYSTGILNFFFSFQY